MDQRPIGVFDSGLGGLTAVHSLWRILPEEDLIYFGDTARVPYGDVYKRQVLQYVKNENMASGGGSPAAGNQGAHCAADSGGQHPAEIQRRQGQQVQKGQLHTGVGADYLQQAHCQGAQGRQRCV